MQETTFLCLCRQNFRQHYKAAAGHISLAISGDPDTQDEFEDAQLSTLNATLVRSSIIDTPNPAAGVDIAQAGFALIDGNGNPVRAQYLMEFAVFDDVNLVALASNATLNTIAKGTIVSGAGTNALRVITDANGEFECTLTDLVDPETVYVNASSGRGSPTIDGREIDAISFS